MLARTTVLLVVMTAVLLAGVASPSAAESEQTAAAKAVAGRMLVAPRSEALVKRLQVRVVVRVPARTTRLRVRLGRRDVTARFTRGRGSLRVARLSRSDGLRYGPNHLVVLAQRRARRPVIDARSFVVVRRQDDLAHMRIRRGPVMSVDVRVARNAPLTAEHFGRPREVTRRLGAIRRERTAHLWLNGRRITRGLDRSRVTHWTARLSATHGLRHGVNRLRLLVVEPDRGRYALLRRRFVVRRHHHLAAAGWDTATRLGGRVLLDGRRSRAAGGGKVDHRWRILSKPRGSRAKLRRAGTARPVLRPDRRGRYVVGLTVRPRTRRASASQAVRSSADWVIVTAAPRSLLLPFKGLTVKDGRAGIQVGGTFYPNQSPGGTGLQWLTLDRSTLTPTKTGNSWLDGSRSDGDHGIGALADALSPADPDKPDAGGKLGINQLVILSFPYAGGPGPPVAQGQIDAFNDAMKALGVGPIDAGILQDRNKLAIVGVPFGGAGSGSYTHGGGPVDALTGWLMPDAVKAGDAFRFRFQPERPAFDTSASHTQTTNTMTVRGQRFDAALPEGATGGFQVVTFDPIDLTPRDHKVFGTNGDPQRGYDVNGRAFMALFLDASRGLHVAVQSIGHVAPGPFEANVSSWSNLGQALAAHGANPHIFNTVDGSYAFFGGSWLERSQVEDSSSTVVIDPTADPPKREAGTLGGRLSMRDDGYWMPAVTDPTDSLQFSLYDIVFRAPTPWPYTAGGAFPQQKGCPAPGNDAAAYSAALSYIADGIGLAATFKTNLRAAYVSRDRLNWHNQHSNLLALPYQRGNGFGQAEFCNLKAQLKQEFEWLDSIKENLFDGYKDVLSRSGGQQEGNLDAIGTAVITSIDPDRSADAGWSVGAFLGNLGSALILGANPEATTILAAWEMVVTTYELARELASGEGDMPVGEQFKTKVEGLSADVASRLAAAANGLDRLRDVIISDYGRLQALGAVADDPSWNVDVPTAADSLSTAANGFFSAALLPISYGVHALVGSPDDPEKCRDLLYGYPWAGAPASVQMEWRGGYDLDGWKNDRGRFILGRHRLKQFTPAYPPAEVSKAFRPTTQGGYGLQLSRFIWESYKAPAGKRYPPTDIAQCHS